MGTATAGLPNSWKVVALYQGHLPLDANIAEGVAPFLSACNTRRTRKPWGDRGGTDLA